MSFLETIKPHVISDDILVQETVLHAIHDYPFIPEDWTVELLKEAFSNKEKQSSILIYISNQKINEEALNVLIDKIPKMDQSVRHLAINLLDQVDPRLALTYKEQLERYLPKETWALYELIENGTEEEVYMEYGGLVNELEDAKGYQHTLFVKAKKLAKCIVKNEWITEREIDVVMAEELEADWFSYNGFLHVYMIGLLQNKKYIPVLTSLLNRDEDILLEEVANALIQFQSDEVVEAVGPYLKMYESLIFATSVVENIKTDLSVQVLIEAYQETEDFEDQELIVEALCHHYSKEALPIISDHMKSKYTNTLVDLEQAAYGTYTILGEKHPDLMQWKQEASKKGNSMLFNVPVKNDNKVGRNDPCPCGSGKKYKKCCGK